MKSIFSVPALVKNIFKYDSREELEYKTIDMVSVFFGIILYLENVHNIDNLAVVLLTYIVGSALILMPIISKRIHNNNKRNFYLGYVIFLAAVLTLYALFGVNDGMANYWAVLTMLVVMTLYGMPTGLAWGTYFFTLCSVFFWTPIRHIMPYHYTDEYCFVFPLIFLCSFVGSFVANLFYKKGRIEQERQDEQLHKELEGALDNLDEAMIESVKIISTMIDERDMYTKEHSVRVAKYSKMLADEYGFGNDVKRMRSIYNAALLHDMGKIAIPDEILKLGQRLSDEEYEAMKLHTVYGEAILKELTFLPTVYYGAKYHHENLDGTGYPAGIMGDEIPIEARIITVADTLDAMNSKRVYRDPRSKEYILKTFREGAGTQFDKEIADIVCRLIEEGKIKIVAEDEQDS